VTAISLSAIYVNHIHTAVLHVSNMCQFDIT